MGSLVKERLGEEIQFGGKLRIVYEPARTSSSDKAEIERSTNVGSSPVVILDYSSPDFLLSEMKQFKERNRFTRWLVGSTGWSPTQEKALESFQSSQLILKAANFSLGVLFLRKALKSVEGEFQRAGFNASIEDVHHSRKKDAPSGTALLLKNELKSFHEVPIESRREGDVVGFHEIVFESVREKVSFSHDAKNRSVFADGALRSVEAFASWPMDRKGQVYSLEDLF